MTIATTTLDDLADVGQRIEALEAELAAARAARDEIVRAALSDGVPAVEVAKAARVHLQRVYQIRDRRR